MLGAGEAGACCYRWPLHSRIQLSICGHPLLLTKAELEARLATATASASSGAAAQRRSSAAEGMAAEMADQMRHQAEELAELQV